MWAARRELGEQTGGGDGSSGTAGDARLAKLMPYKRKAKNNMEGFAEGMLEYLQAKAECDQVAQTQAIIVKGFLCYVMEDSHGG